MATTAMLPLSRVTLSRPCDLHCNPLSAHPPSLHYREGGAHACTCLASTQSEASQKRSPLPFQAHTHGWVPPCRRRRAASQAWRCYATAQSGEQDGELNAVPADRLVEEGKDRTGEAETVLANWNKDQAGALEKSFAGPPAQVEEKDAYLGPALKVGKGALIAELLQIFNNLLQRPYGGGESVANAGAAVMERVVSDVQELRGQEGVSDQILFELLKVIRLLEMDMELVRAARKEETLMKRLETAQTHCKQAVIIASSF